MEDDTVKVSIANAESVSDDDSKAYTVYYVDFEYRGLKWRVTHRYSALFDMAQKVKKEFPDVDLPHFPKRRLWGSLKPEIIMKRTYKIERFLQFIVNHPTIIGLDDVRQKLNLDNLISMRKASLPVLEKLTVPKGAIAAADTQCIPGHIKNMVEYLRQKGLNKEYIFYRSAATSSLQTIKDRIQQGENVDYFKEQTDPIIVASFLKQFLEEMTEPLLTPYLGFLAIDELKSKAEKMEVVNYLLSTLRRDQRHLITYILDLVLSILQNVEYNKMDMKKVIPIFGPLFLRPLKNEGPVMGTDPVKVHNVLKLILENRAYLAVEI